MHFPIVVVALWLLLWRCDESGVGPVAVAPVSGGRFVLITDKHLNSVLLLDLWTAGTIADFRIFDAARRFRIDEPATWPDLVGVATCNACDFGKPVLASLFLQPHRVLANNPTTPSLCVH